MATISTIIPTIGRVESLRALLESIFRQTRQPDEILVADGSNADAITGLFAEPEWFAHGLKLTHLKVSPPNAVRQREAAIARANGDYLFLLDDDVVLDPDCLAKMAELLDAQPELSAVTADFSNQSWSNPTKLWRCYMRLFHGIKKGEWQGRVVGPLLRFGYNPSPSKPMPMQWLGAGNSLIRRSAFEAAGGFSDFFLHRCTMNEDVDLGLKLNRQGPILLHPEARLAHHHAPGGRVSIRDAAEDDIFNRYMVLKKTQHRNSLSSSIYTVTYVIVESISGLSSAIRSRNFSNFLNRAAGYSKGLHRIIKFG
jgi:GT2 family glycosyltransferase